MRPSLEFQGLLPGGLKSRWGWGTRKERWGPAPTLEEGRRLLRKQWASWSTPAVWAAGSIRLGRDLETGCVLLVSHPWTGRSHSS